MPHSGGLNKGGHNGSTSPTAHPFGPMTGAVRLTTTQERDLVRYGTEPTTEQLVDATRFGRVQIARLLAAARVPTRFEEPAGDDRGDAVADHVRDGDAEQPF